MCVIQYTSMADEKLPNTELDKEFDILSLPGISKMLCSKSWSDYWKAEMQERQLSVQESLEEIRPESKAEEEKRVTRMPDGTEIDYPLEPHWPKFFPLYWKQLFEDLIEHHSTYSFHLSTFQLTLKHLYLANLLLETNQYDHAIQVS